MASPFHCKVTSKAPPLIRYPESLKSSRVKNCQTLRSFHSHNPKYVWTPVYPKFSTGLWRLHRLLGHIVFSGAFRNLAAETIWRCDPGSTSGATPVVRTHKASQTDNMMVGSDMINNEELVCLARNLGAVNPNTSWRSVR